MDDWDYVEEVDILPKLPADFFKTVQDPKWSIRKESLDALCALLAANPRLSVKANYGEIAGVLQTVYQHLKFFLNKLFLDAFQRRQYQCSSWSGKVHLWISSWIERKVLVICSIGMFVEEI